MFTVGQVVLIQWDVCLSTFETLVVALGEEEHGLGSALRSLEQTLAVGVLAQGAQQHAVGVRHVGQQGLARGRAVV